MRKLFIAGVIIALSSAYAQAEGVAKKAFCH